MDYAPAATDALPDRICQLRTAELLLLAAGRLWVAAYLDPARQGPDWRDGFAAAGIDPEAADRFDALFGMLAAGATREIGFHCPTCTCLGRDEALLLRAFGHLQHGRAGEAERLLGAFLAPAAARLAVGPAGDVAAAMLAAGLRLPAWDRIVTLSQFSLSDHGIGLVH